MKFRLIFTSILLMLILVVSAYAAPDTTQQLSSHNHPPMIKASGVNPPKHLVTPPKTDFWYSQNWAGYAVSGPSNSVTNVKGTWIVPTVQTTARNQYSGNWIGIDGFNSGSVEQCGTDSNTDSRGEPVYDAWYEFYPAPCYMFPNFPVVAGDKITADVTYNPSTTNPNTGTYTVSLTNARTNFIATATSSSMICDRSSAEWVTEAPSMGNNILPLTNFGITLFGSQNTFTNTNNVYTMNGNTKTINSDPTITGGTINSIDMISTKSKKSTVIVKAQTGDLSPIDGASFPVTWMKAL